MARGISDGDAWKRVWAHVFARQQELGWNFARLCKETVSDTTYYAMQKGKPLTSIERRRSVTDGLGWTPDSIDRILNGSDPIIEVKPGDTVDLATVAAQLEALARELANLAVALRESSRPPERGSPSPSETDPSSSSLK